MKFIFSTGSLYTYGTARCFQLAARAGFDGVEIMVDARWDTRQETYLQRLMDHYGLPILAVHSPFRSVPGWPGDQPSMIRRSVALADSLGAPVVVHHLPLRLGYAMLQIAGRSRILPLFGWDMERDYRLWLQKGYAQLQDEARATLCIENMPARRAHTRALNVHYWNTVDEITRFPTLTMDTTHLATWGLDPNQVYTRWGRRVRHIHLSNYDGSEHRRPEYGRLRLDHLLSRLATTGYDGAISLELHPDALHAGGDDDQVAMLLANSLQLCRSWAATPALAVAEAD